MASQHHSDEIDYSACLNGLFAHDLDTRADVTCFQLARLFDGLRTDEAFGADKDG